MVLLIWITFHLSCIIYFFSSSLVIITAFGLITSDGETIPDHYYYNYHYHHYGHILLAFETWYSFISHNLFLICFRGLFDFTMCMFDTASYLDLNSKLIARPAHAGSVLLNTWYYVLLAIAMFVWGPRTVANTLTRAIEQMNGVLPW